MLVSISGIDSAGKSTQIMKTKDSFLNSHKKVVVIWSRGGYTFLFNSIKIILRKLFPNRLPPSGNSIKRDKAFTKIWVQKVWINLAIFDLILLYGIYFRLKKKTGYIIIADRYLWDTFIDFSLRFKKIHFENFFLWKFLKFISPIPDYSFIITIPVEESIRRSLIKKEPFSENFNEREKR